IDTTGPLRRKLATAGGARAVPAAAAGLVLLANGCALPGAAVTSGADQYAGGQYARAAASYREAIGDGDQRPQVLYNLGTALLAADSLEKSLEPLERSALSESTELRYRALFNLGLAQLRIGRESARDADSTRRILGTAVELYKRVLLMRPDDVDAKWNYELALNELSQLSSPSQREQDQQPQDPRDTPDQPPPPSLGRDQAEQLLSSAAREEQAVQGRKQREARPTPARRGKDW
ncbi:partial mxaK protein, partial [Anaerolineae bacterium]